ncbi:MAG: phosphatidylserine synthase [Cyanobacteria bacterium RYN_339]|nr:phosphatidylserine synthase [Cyanobacteria bacterium RYN_339]
MLNTLTSQTNATGHAYRSQAARPGDSSGGINVLPGMPGGALAARIELLGDTTELQGALMEVVNEARTSIKADFHLLKGPAGQELARQLARRARQGLRVQLLAWGPSTPAFAEAVRTARAQGLNVRVARGGQPNANAVGKFMVADDRTALVGHAGLGGRARRGLWRVSGEAAGEIGRQFNHDWADAGGTPMPLANQGDYARQGRADTLSQVHVGGNGPQRKLARGLVLGALQRARTTIEVMGDRVDDPAVVAALIAAHRRGVQVKVLLGSQAGEGGWLNGQAGAIARLQRAGVPVRRYHRAGTALAVELRFGVVDGEAVLFGSMPWTAAGFAAGGEVLLEARGGREIASVRAAFRHDWDQSEAATPPSRGTVLSAKLAPALAAIGRVVSRYSPAKVARQVLDLQVGVVRFPGGKWKVVTDTRRTA